MNSNYSMRLRLSYLNYFSVYCVLIIRISKYSRGTENSLNCHTTHYTEKRLEYTLINIYLVLFTLQSHYSTFGVPLN